MTPFKFVEKLYESWNGVFQAADGEDLVILACAIFDWSTSVTVDMQFLVCFLQTACVCMQNLAEISF